MASIHVGWVIYSCQLGQSCGESSFLKQYSEMVKFLNCVHQSTVVKTTRQFSHASSISVSIDCEALEMTKI